VEEATADKITKQGHDLEIGTNCLGPYLLTLLLEPLLTRTAAMQNTPSMSVRIVWVVALLQRATPPGGMSFDASGTPVIVPGFMQNYFQSKAGAAWLATEFARRLGDKGIMSTVRLNILGIETERASIDVIIEPPPWLDAH
jgi:retinol dehydrogenase 12